MSGQNEELDGLMSLLGASAPSGTMCGSNCNTIGGSTEWYAAPPRGDVQLMLNIF